MAASLTRFLGGLDELTEVALDERVAFCTRHFTLCAKGNGWQIEPSPSLTTELPWQGTDEVLLQGRPISSPHPLQDDDLISAGLAHWVFHQGDIARHPTMEQRALDEGGATWAVLADWLAERGDPLGARLNAHRGTHSSPHSPWNDAALDAIVDLPGIEPRFLVTGDAMFRLECAERDGLVSSLTARSMSSTDNALAAVLQLRRVRFLEHLVLDVPGDSLEAWIRHLGAWPLPQWLKTITLGVEYGAQPEGWQSPRLPMSLREKCPRLQLAPLVRWATRAKLEIVENASAYVVRGIGAGESRQLQSGTVLELEGKVLWVREEASFRPERHYIFELVGSRWFLIASDANEGGTARQWTSLPKPIAASIAGWRVRRTPLLHDDRIEVEPGLVFRFRLDP